MAQVHWRLKFLFLWTKNYLTWDRKRIYWPSEANTSQLEPSALELYTCKGFLPHEDTLMEHMILESNVKRHAYNTFDYFPLSLYALGKCFIVFINPAKWGYIALCCLPPAVRAFFKRRDLSNKRIGYFTVHLRWWLFWSNLRVTSFGPNGIRQEHS